jgi:hypothetical protein
MIAHKKEAPAATGAVLAGKHQTRETIPLIPVGVNSPIKHESAPRNNLYYNPDSEAAVLAYLLQNGGDQLGSKVEEGIITLIATQEGKQALQIITEEGIIGDSAILSLPKAAAAKGVLDRIRPIIGSITMNIGKMSELVLEQELEKLRGCRRERETARLLKAGMDGQMASYEVGKQLLALDPQVSVEIDKEVKPPVLSPQALFGVAGDIVRKIEPQTEAHPAALLLQLLTGIGSIIGRGPHFLTGPDQHHCNLYAVIVGNSSRGRKGTSWGYIRNILQEVDPVWLSSRVRSGLASGEGIVHELKDPEDGTEKDKRLLVTETEMAQALNAMNRNGSTLSATLRNGWDSGFLANMSKAEPGIASNCHISIVGHITRHEIRELLTSNDAANGFANRCLWVHSARTKLLPRGGESLDFSNEIKTLQSVVIESRRLGQLKRNPEAEDLWDIIYPELTSEDVTGLWAKTTSRGEAQVVRLSLLFALLDHAETIALRHLQAAKAVWDYCFHSARWVFEESAFSPNALKILDALEKRPHSRTEISHLFQNHRSKREIDHAIGELEGIVEQVEIGTGGREAKLLRLRKSE